MSEPVVQRDLEAEAWRLYDGAIDAKEYTAAQKVLEFVERIRGVGRDVKGTAPDAPLSAPVDTSLEAAREAVNTPKK